MTSFPMVIPMRENIKEEKLMGMGYIHGLMGVSMKGHLRMERSMEREDGKKELLNT